MTILAAGMVASWLACERPGHAAVGDAAPSQTPSTNGSAAILVTLGEPRWFSNIRNERLVEADVRITNVSDRSFWILSRGTMSFVHDYERRLSARDKWETVTFFCATGTYPHEILPGASFVTRKVFLNPRDVGFDVRLRVRLYRQFVSPGPNVPFFAGLRDPEEFLSNIVHIGTDPLSTQPAAGGDAR